MYQYANGFRITVKNDNSEVLIRLIQALPAPAVHSQEKTARRDVVEEVVADVILHGDMALNLADKLHELLAEDTAQ